MELAEECGAGDIAAGSAGPRLPEGAPNRGRHLHCTPGEPAVPQRPLLRAVTYM